MKVTTETIDAYMEQLPDDRKEVMKKLHITVLSNLPKGFEAQINYGMIGYVVPHSIYPAGYHCNPKLPLPFINIASQKNGISFFHMGIYADVVLLNWFQSEYPKHCKSKLDMGKSCIRFKKAENIPFDLLAELVRKMSVADWIKTYELGVEK
jgi:uncharacterized protein YdhG (YjbR/CyaY superfamily)